MISPFPPKTATPLQLIWLKYRALVEAKEGVGRLRQDPDWKDHLVEAGFKPGESDWIPHYAEMVNIFIAKTVFYDTWSPPFNRLLNGSKKHEQTGEAPEETSSHKYIEMIKWLNGDCTVPPPENLWGEKESSVTLDGLTSWLNKHPIKETKSGKGSKKKEKKRKEETSESDLDSDEKKAREKRKGKQRKVESDSGSDEEPVVKKKRSHKRKDLK